MSSESEKNQCEQAERVSLYALRALPASEVSDVEAHVSGCAECRRDLERLRPIFHSQASWPTELLYPSESLWGRLALRLAAESGCLPIPVAMQHWSEPEWDEVAPGISCKVLALDTDWNRVSMLVRVGPEVEYPPHRHAGVEELFLLDGKLWINDRKLRAGDYNRAEAGSADKRVWSEIGCMCVLITSLQDGYARI